MKSKPAFLIFGSCLFAFVLLLSITGNTWAQEKTATGSQAAKMPVKPVKKDADYWFNKGALVST